MQAKEAPYRRVVLMKIDKLSADAKEINEVYIKNCTKINAASLKMIGLNIIN